MRQPRSFVPFLLLTLSAMAQSSGNEIPTHYDSDWMVDHAASVTAVQSGVLYFKSPSWLRSEFIDVEIDAKREVAWKAEETRDAAQQNRPVRSEEEAGLKWQRLTSVQAGQSYDVIKVIPVVKDTIGHLLEIKAVKWGKATVTEVRQDVFLAKYSGQPITSGELQKGSDFIIVLSRKK
jgi:hypothetical protein